MKYIAFLTRVTVPILRTYLDFLMSAPGMASSVTAMLNSLCGTATRAKLRRKPPGAEGGIANKSGR